MASPAPQTTEGVRSLTQPTATQTISETRELVFVSGVSGYVASFIVKKLLEDGYHVRGSVRSLSDPSKCDFLHRLDPSKEALELVECDLTSPKGWKEAIQGPTAHPLTTCTQKIHNKKTRLPIRHPHGKPHAVLKDHKR